MDTLGSIISPITIVVLYLFRIQFDISKLYGMRSADLVFFMYFSVFLIPALWIVDIFLFNIIELIYSWKVRPLSLLTTPWGIPPPPSLPPRAHLPPYHPVSALRVRPVL